MAAIVAHTGNDNPFNFIINAEGKPNAFLDPVGPWPSAVGSALGEGGEDGNGLHNIAATLQSDSPEFADLPVTDMRVPIFGEMTDDQKQFFLDLCGIGR